MLTSHTIRATPARVALALACLIPAHANAECPFDWRPGDSPPPFLNGTGYEMLTWDPDGPGPLPEWLVVGGSFTTAGNLPALHVAAWDGTTWHDFGSGLINTPSALAVVSGELIAATYRFNPAEIAQVLRWDGASWQQLGPGFDGHVHALIEYQHEIIAAGQFPPHDMGPPRAVVRWDGMQWQPLGSGISEQVYSLAEYEGELIAGGSFTTAGGVPANHVARWDGHDWHPLGDGLNRCEALASGNGNLVAFDGNNHFTEWDGDEWHPLPSFDGDLDLNDMILVDGDVIAGGDSGVARCNGHDWQWLGGPYTRALASFRGDLIACGGLIERWNGTNWENLTHGAGLSGAVSALIRFHGDLIVGGWFTTAGDAPAPFVVGWDGMNWNPLGSGTNAPVFALTEFNATLVAGGSFTTAGGADAGRIAEWSGTGWQPLGAGIAGIDGGVYALTEYNGELIAGGRFTKAGESVANNIARWNGTSWRPLGSGMDWAVYALTEYNGDLIAGGNFTTAGGVSAYGIARWNGAGWQPLAAGVAGTAYALTEFNGELIVGGTFSNAGGVPTTNVARWNGAGWQSLGVGVGPTYLSEVLGLTVYHSELIAGGRFLMAGGLPVNRIARWNGTEWKPLGMGLQSNPMLSPPSANALAISAGQLVVGGEFLSAGQFDSAYLARWSPSIELPSIAQQPTRQTIPLAQPATFQVAATGGQPLIYQWRKNGTNLTDNPNLAGSQTDTLTIASATQADTGQYDCVITNDCGAATTNPARLTVLIPIPGPPLNQSAQPATNN